MKKVDQILFFFAGSSYRYSFSLCANLHNLLVSDKDTLLQRPMDVLTQLRRQIADFTTSLYREVNLYVFLCIFYTSNFVYIFCKASHKCDWKVFLWKVCLCSFKILFVSTESVFGKIFLFLRIKKNLRDKETFLFL